VQEAAQNEAEMRAASHKDLHGMIIDLKHAVTSVHKAHEETSALVRTQQVQVSETSAPAPRAHSPHSLSRSRSASVGALRLPAGGIQPVPTVFVPAQTVPNLPVSALPISPGAPTVRSLQSAQYVGGSLQLMPGGGQLVPGSGGSLHIPSGAGTPVAHASHSPGGFFPGRATLR